MQEKIRDYIKKKGIKFNHVAERSHIPIARFYSLMEGRVKLTADEYEKLCKGLDVDPKYFFD